MTKQAALEKALMQWDYIYMYGGSKQNANIMLDISQFMLSDCALCEYAFQTHSQNLIPYHSYCYYCPVKWVSLTVKNSFHCNDGLFGKWVHSPTKANAHAISNLILDTLNNLYKENIE